MDFIKELFYKFLKLIDDGRFLIKPMKWFYYLKGVVPFLLPLLFIYLVIDDGMHTHFSDWGKILWWIFVVLFTLYLGIVAYINFLFWCNRAKRVDQVVKRGDNIVAIPLVADNIKNTGEILGIMVSVIVIVGAVLFFVFMLLSGEQGFYKDLYFLNLLVKIVVISLVCILITYLIIMLTHFVSERLRMFAQMSNDLRDVADIHRAAAMLSEEEENTQEMIQESTVIDK